MIKKIYPHIPTYFNSMIKKNPPHTPTYFHFLWSYNDTDISDNKKIGHWGRSFLNHQTTTKQTATTSIMNSSVIYEGSYE